MNGNAELLNYIYQNAQRGVDTLEKLMDITDDAEFKKHLETQFKEYDEIHNLAASMLNSHGYDEKGIGAFDKLKADVMIDMQTLTNRSTSHIAEMLMVGSNMGVIQAVKNLKKYQGADKEIRDLMERLLVMEENNIQQLKKFL